MKLLPLVLALAAVLTACSSTAEDAPAQAARPEVRYYVIADT
jgi:ABC-type glycerol-3-phosphate transport system substrate-binding protein